MNNLKDLQIEFNELEREEKEIKAEGDRRVRKIRKRQQEITDEINQITNSNLFEV